MARHITESQRNDIIKMCKKGIPSLEASKRLSISHRTVKIWYESKREKSLADSNLAGLNLYCLQELSRLLCWPAPKLAQCLQAYMPRLHKRVININSSEPRKRSKPNQRSKPLVSERTLQRYIAACYIKNESDKIITNVRKGWGAGEVAVHAVRVSWWEHGEESRIKKVNVSSKRATGWLLLMTDRVIINVRDTAPRELKVKFQLLQGVHIDLKQVINSVSEAICKYYKNTATLHLVTNEQDKPTVGSTSEELKSAMSMENIVADIPTKVAGSIAIPASFPNRRSVENYLAIILASKDGIPDFRDSKWANVHTHIADDNFVVEKLGELWPFLARDKPVQS